MASESWVATLVKRSLVWWFRRQNWTVEGTAPMPRKFVVIAAPHTSNWDFVYFIGAADDLNLKLSFMGKTSLFRWPWGKMMRDLGGIPVDRTRSNNMVDAMVAEFARRAEFMLTIAPEGTRHKVRQWKTGFYHIAEKAGVPMVCGLMDYKRKVVGLGPAIWPTGNYQADMAIIGEYYSRCTPRHPTMGYAGIPGAGDTP